MAKMPKYMHVEWAVNPTEFDSKGYDGIYIRSIRVDWWGWPIIWLNILYGRIRKMNNETLSEHASKPVAIDNPNLDSLIRACQEYLDQSWNGNYVDDDISHYIFEEAMVAIFGKNIFGLINKRNQERY